MFAQVERFEVGQRFDFAVGNLIERLFHARRKLRIDQRWKMHFQQPVHGQRGKSRHQLIAGFDHIAAILNGADDGGVGAGPTYAFLFERLHQRGFGKACRRLSLVPDRGNGAAVQFCAYSHRGQQDGPIIKGGFRVVSAFDVDAEEARKVDTLAVGLKGRVGRLNGDRDQRQPRLGHLRRHRPLPDHVVQARFDAMQPKFVCCAHYVSGRADRLMRFLCAFRLSGVLARLVAQIVGTVAIRDGLSRGAYGLVGQMHRVGTHIGNMPFLVQLLGNAHRIPCGHLQLAVGFLLKRGGGERWRRAAILRFFDRITDPPDGLQQRFAQGGSLRFIEQQYLFAGGDVPGVLVEILTSSDSHAIDGIQRRLKTAAGRVLIWL